MAGKDPTIDDLFKVTESFTKKMHDYMSGKGFEEKFAHAMLNATDPDSKFKADMAMKISTITNLLAMLVNYINKPVKKEGILQRKLDGMVMLDDIPIPDGSLIEFWKEDKWNLGKIAQNNKTKQSSIVDVSSGKILIEKIEQIKARVR